MLTTTLKKIREHRPCDDGWKKLLKHLGKTQADSKPLPLEIILESNGLDDAMWALRAVDGHQGAIRLYACYCAKRALPVFEKQYPDDKRPRHAIETAERFAAGQATREECCAAGVVARYAAMDAARAASSAARAAASVAAWDAASAARAAAWDAAGDAASAARAAAWDDSWVDAWVAVWDDFRREFIRLCRLEGEYGKVSAQEAAERGEV